MYNEVRGIKALISRDLIPRDGDLIFVYISRVLQIFISIQVVQKKLDMQIILIFGLRMLSWRG